MMKIDPKAIQWDEPVAADPSLIKWDAESIQWDDDQQDLSAQNDQFNESTGTLENIGNNIKRGWYGLKSTVAGLMAAEPMQRAADAEQTGDWVEAYDPAGNPVMASELGLFLPDDIQQQRIDATKALGKQAAVDLAASTAKNNAATAAIPMRPATQAMTQAKTFGDSLDALMEDPLGVIGDLGVQSSVQMAPALVVTVLSRNPAFVALANFSNSSAIEYGSGVVDYLAQSGVDTSNEEAVRAALESPETVRKALDYASTRAGIVGGFDAASGGFASKVLIPGKGVVREGVNALVAQPALQAGLGAGGEAAAQLATTGEVRPGEVLAEAAGEMFTAPLEAASFAAERRKSVTDRVFGGPGIKAGDVLGDVGDDTAPIKAEPKPMTPGGRGYTFDESGNVIEERAGLALPPPDPVAPAPGTDIGPAGPREGADPVDFIVDPEGGPSAPGDWRARSEARRARSGGPGMGPAVDGEPTMAPEDMAQAAFDTAMETAKSAMGRAPSKSSANALASRIAERFGVDPAALIERNRNPVRTGRVPTQGVVGGEDSGAIIGRELLIADKRGRRRVKYTRRDDGRIDRKIIYDDGEVFYEFLVTDKNGDEQWVSSDGYNSGEFYPVTLSPDEAEKIAAEDAQSIGFVNNNGRAFDRAPAAAVAPASPAVEPAPPAEVPRGRMFRQGNNAEAVQAPNGTWYTRRRVAGRWQPWQRRRSFDPSGAHGYSPYQPPSGNVRTPAGVIRVGDDRREAKPTGPRPPSDIIQVIAAAGGINREAARRAGVDPAMLQRRVGIRPLFPINGGMPLNGMRELLTSEGFFPPDDPDAPPTVSDDDAFEVFNRALQGERIVSPNRAAEEAAYQASQRDAGRAPAEIDQPAAESRTDDDERLAAEFLSRVESDPVASRIFGDFSAEEDAEAMEIVELAERAMQLGATPAEVRQAYNAQGDAELARNLWELIRTKEIANGPVAREGQARDRNGDQAQPGGAETARNAAQRQPAAGNEGASAPRPVEPVGQAESEEVARLRARIAELEAAQGVNEVTGLPGKSRFEADEALGWASVSAIDMDGLGRLNDATSHEAANVVLRALADAMRNFAGQFDGVRFYHLHGDELAARFSDPDAAERVMLQLQQYLAEFVVPLRVTLADGSVRAYSYDGIGITYGLGANYETADAAAIVSKREREAAGQRQNKNQPGPPRQLRDLAADSERREGDRRAAGYDRAGGVAVEGREGLTNEPRSDDQAGGRDSQIAPAAVERGEATVRGADPGRGDGADAGADAVQPVNDRGIRDDGLAQAGTGRTDAAPVAPRRNDDAPADPLALSDETAVTPPPAAPRPPSQNGLFGQVTPMDVDRLNYERAQSEARTDPSRAPRPPASDTVDIEQQIARESQAATASDTDVDSVDVATLAGQDDLMARADNGAATLADIKAGFEALVKNREPITAELSKLTKAQLLERHRGFNRPDTKKDGMVADAFRQMVTAYNFKGALAIPITSGDYTGSYIAAVRAKLDATTDEDLRQHAANVAKHRAERKERAEKLADTSKLETYEDFSNYIRAQQAVGKTFTEARMTLTPEQRAKLDVFMAERSRNDRARMKNDRKTEVRSAGQTTAGEVIATKHTKHGHDLFVVQLAERVERSDYETLNNSAKRLGGSYSSYRGNGAVPGFQFRTRDAAEAFRKLVFGDTSAAAEVAQARRDAFDDDRSQSAVERLNEMADRLDERASESLSRDRKANTERRARFAAGAEAAARSEQALAATMRKIAKAIADGSAKFLDDVRTKKQVEYLRDTLNTAKYDELRARFPNSYGEQEKRRGEPWTAETADYARWPEYTLYRSDWAKLGRQLQARDGSKLLGQRLLKVADDIDKPYTDFLKKAEGLTKFKLFPFTKTDGAAAIFPTETRAEAALERSGLREKGFVFQLKRGQYILALSPTEARAQGLWEGADDQRITMRAEFVEELMEKAKRHQRGADKIDLPWTLDSMRDRRRTLAAMGIETPAEFRSALREFIALAEVPTAPSRVKELERAMVGRVNDGLDFFPTSPDVVAQMLEAAEIEPGMSVLEPSAGMGHIADAMRDAGVDPAVIEISPSRRELLDAKGYALVGSDFIEHQGQYDRIVMNPPFSKRRDVQHVRHAYSLLNPGGRLVAIMGEGSFFGQDKAATEFREWMESVDGTSEKLPEGSFQDPSLPVNTAVNARMVVIDKPAAPADSAFATSVPGWESAETDTDRLSDEAIDREVAKARAEFGDAVTIEVMDSIQDSPASDRTKRLYPGANGLTDGKSRVWIFRRGLQSLQSLRTTLAHEIIGHIGVERVIGSDWPAVMDAIKRIRDGKLFASPAVVNAIRSAESRYPGADDLTFAREAVAIMAESGITGALWDRIVAAVRRYLRKVFGSLQWSESEVRDLLRRAGEAARKPAVMKGAEFEAAQVVFHGTPHKVDRFRMDKIGTGEGNQAYGWGAYFASRRGVADFYRDALTDTIVKFASEEAKNKLLSGDADRAIAFARGQIKEGGSIASVIEEVRQGARNFRDRKPTSYRQEGPDLAMAAAFDAVADALESGDLVIEKEKGNLYSVDIPDDSDLLDWDKPLSEQPENVREAILDVMQVNGVKRGEKTPLRSVVDLWGGIEQSARMHEMKMTGQGVYHHLIAQSGGAKAASELLNAAGVPGLRYLDGNSRNNGEGSHNYVIWDEAAIGEPMMASNPASGPIERKMADDARAGQPIDKLFRLPFHLFGLDSHGRLKPGTKLYDWLTRVVAEKMPAEDGPFGWMAPILKTMRSGLIDRYGVPQDFVQRDERRESEVRSVLMHAARVAADLEGLTTAEAKVLQAMLTGQEMPVGELGKLSQPIKEAIDQMGREAVELGLISPEAYERNRGAYLHRSYLKYEADRTPLGKAIGSFLDKRRKKLLGDTLRRRGMTMERDAGAIASALGGPVREGDTVTVLRQKTEAGGVRTKYQRGPLNGPAPVGWENLGDWRVMGFDGKKAKLWRDFTPAEREKMGEILDARYNITKTFALMAHDLATGRFLRDIAANPDWARADLPEGATAAEARGRYDTYADADWVRVPDAAIPGTNDGKGNPVKRWGELAGMYVRAPIWRDLNQLREMQNPQVWGSVWNKVLTFWKTSKTARNPVVHVNNVMSNMMFMDLADIRLRDLYRAIGAWRRGESDDDYRDAMAHGAFGGGFADQELKRKVLQPILDDILAKQKTDGQDTAEDRLDVLHLLSTIWDGIKKVDGKMLDAYNAEDEIFRLAFYLRRQSLGDTPEEAARSARRQFIDYDIRAPWVNAARNTVLPFIGYTYRSIPILAQAIAERPWKLAKYATLAAAANWLGYLFAPGDEDDERKVMAPAVQGNTWTGTPRMIRMPWYDADGNPVFLDVRRWIPAGDVFDMNQSEIGLPAWLQFGGPLQIAGELMLNKQAFTKQPIVDPLTDTTGEKAAKLASWGWKAFAPNAPWIPESYSWDKIAQAITGETDELGRDFSVIEAASSVLGIKAAGMDVDLQRRYRAREFDRVERELDFDLTSLKREYQRKKISQPRFKAAVDRIYAKKRALAEERRRVLSRTSKPKD